MSAFFGVVFGGSSEAFTVVQQWDTGGFISCRRSYQTM